MDKLVRDFNNLNSKKVAIERETARLRTTVKELNETLSRNRKELSEKTKLLQEAEKVRTRLNAQQDEFLSYAGKS